MSLSFAQLLRRAGAERAAIAARRKLAAPGADAIPGDLDESLGRSRAERPGGTLLWVHLAPGVDPRGIRSLLAALRQEHRDLSCLLSCDEPSALRAACGEVPGERVVAAPIDTPAIAQRFLSHWRPDMAIWVGMDMRPALAGAALDRGVPMGGIDLDLRALPGRFRKGGARQLARFRFLLASTPPPAGLESQLGRAVERVGRLRPLQAPLRCNEGEREHLAGLLLSRPVWLAAGLRAEELAAVATAHRIASHLSHRLLLIVVPEAPEEGAMLRDRLAAQGWRCALRSADEEPRDDTAIYVADTAGEDGLWYRLAPISFLGGTLSPPAAGRDPGAPAALGSAVLHGPATAAHADSYAALHQGRAAWRVRDGEDLGRVVERLLSPEKVARLAHAAWMVTTDGADAFNRAHELIEAMLDEVSQ
ncbi:3-deoxy-D-manno-octulosonic acid transferase [Profundibacterium mesophilum]|uniref:3-deoxy-D-manno-octulosonic acid transferase n=1 Tax=Profundibacterium mesophilum KAUST100406-0324 TaxID=1037889 RepID=A0A921TBE8_9RHOB|nr:glycosyltransferase N-terminal domain-containing protein [Profundibacterium mesophilum]KAF0675480.1 putative 3-deoxy-D-manno-octulosonic-acid transferase [Profundibacterium mesophilum KAUST100406-0324]